MPDLLSKFRVRWLLAVGLTPLAGCEYATLDCTDSTIDANGLATCEDGKTQHRPEPFTCAELGPATTGEACQSDEHCPKVEGFSNPRICVCQEDGGHCQFSFCRSDLDCESPFACARLEGSEQFACQSADDECMYDEDCDGDGRCSYENGRRYCLYPEPPCDDCPIDGRPFLVRPRESACTHSNARGLVCRGRDVDSGGDVDR